MIRELFCVKVDPGNSELTDSAKYPILLDASHHFITLVVWRCHERVMHGGVKETLTELRSNFWIVRGRYFIRSLLFRCTVCKKFEGKPYKVPQAPPLPNYRVKEAPAFSYIGLDYVGPLFVKSTSDEERKVWICLFTCCSTREVHFEVVPNMTSEAFLRCFRRFVARRSRPSLVVSDKAKKPSKRVPLRSLRRLQMIPVFLSALPKRRSNGPTT